ncbi:MAG: hypothetical protein IJU40_04220, partial [Desulfovibrionaceae bacterium]|nr:hypothetical protein [Desulfovibrionaceae bacterium]
MAPIYSYYDYSRNYGRNEESFYVRSFKNRMAFIGQARRLSSLNFNNFRNIRLRFLAGKFYYGRYLATFSHINTIYATQGNVNLDFAGMHQNVNIVTGQGDDVVTVGKGKVSINMGYGDDTLEIANVGASSTYDGGNGSDTVVFTNKSVNASLTDSSLTLGKKTASLKNFNTFRALNGHNRLNFFRLRRNVNIFTGGGHDTVILGRGRTNLNLGSGNDSVLL